MIDKRVISNRNCIIKILEVFPPVTPGDTKSSRTEILNIMTIQEPLSCSKITKPPAIDLKRKTQP